MSKEMLQTEDIFGSRHNSAGYNRLLARRGLLVPGDDIDSDKSVTCLTDQIVIE